MYDTLQLFSSTAIRLVVKYLRGLDNMSFQDIFLIALGIILKKNIFRHLGSSNEGQNIVFLQK